MKRQIRLFWFWCFWIAEGFAHPDVCSDPANCGLQYGIETSLGGVEIAGNSFFLKLAGKEVQVFGQLDDVFERERRVAVGPWFCESEGNNKMILRKSSLGQGSGVGHIRPR